MTGHAHDWQPVPLAAGQYACSCGATGFRSLSSGAIVPHRTRVDYREPRVDAAPVADERVFAGGRDAYATMELSGGYRTTRKDGQP